MPDFKKKKHNRLTGPVRRPKSSKSRAKHEDIEMKPHQPKQVVTPAKVRVVKGNKPYKSRKIKITAAVMGIVVAVLIILETVLPAGIAVGISQTFAMLGAGSYPITLDSNETINTVSKGNYSYVLTNSHIYSFSNSGKLMLSFAHRFENPVIKTSASRAIVFNQGGTEALIFDIKAQKAAIKTEKPILTAAISNSGSYAIATTSNKYASDVTVYKKNGKQIYEWYSADITVNNIALSSNGKKLAVAGIDLLSSEHKSKLCVLKFDSPTPVYSEELTGNIVYTLDSSFKRGFFAVCDNSIKYIKWSNYKKSEYTNEYNTVFFKVGNGGCVAVYNRESDRTDNRIAVFSGNGKLKYEMAYKGIIGDVAVRHGNIYCMNDSEVVLLDEMGKVIRKATCDFGSVNLSVTGQNRVAVLSDDSIESISLESVE